MAADAAASIARVVLWTSLPIMFAVSKVSELTLVPAMFGALAAMVAAFGAALCVADADMPLLMRGKHPEGAYSGKTCIVVGASRGFGASLATYLAQSGASLVLCARGTAQLQVRCCQYWQIS